MQPTWKILGVLLLLNVATAAAYSALVGSYIATLIRYLAAKEPGSFDCWFYETTEPPQRSILDYIITLNQAVMIPQRIFHATYAIEASRLPALLIVNYNRKYFLEIGRPFSTFEVFTVPFRQEVWIGFFAFLLICILVMILQPIRITNNLILLPMCGFERREFHLVSAGEKTILITLTVIFFALLSAYEAKIIAFMTEFPHQADPRTLDDLLRRNITIQQYGESWGRFMFEDDPRIGQLFARSAHQSQHDIQWDSQEHALTGGRSFMQMVLSHPNNYDPDTGRQRFIILSDFTLGIRIMFMFCGRRNPLAPKIKLQEVWRFEAGLYDFWAREQTRHEFGIRQTRYLCLDSVDVGIAELEPAWYALGIGMGLGCVALVLEFMQSMIPHAMVIAAPSGRRLTALEIFTIPFQRELWIWLMTFLLISVLLMLLFPTGFTNNLILLPVCGFDRRQFHLVSTLEKTFLIALIVIYFVLLSAYQAKIITLMTEFPHAADPRTLDDLLRNNMTVQFSHDWSKPMIEDDPRMGHLDRTFMKFALNDRRNFDPVTGRPRLVILDEFTLGVRISFYFCGYRNPLVAKIRRAEMLRFETGLYDSWARKRFRQEFGVRQSRFMFFEGVDIGITELEPAWYALAIG
ncbi:hypothetical protein pipiens_004139 [Culex pipiens pipiens]|uniref:Uncharacterized protein n=1 Tax=Culex pipiens pipiens TaxID=38569 RepID=A0ABD1CMP6_CULPP